MIWSALTAEFRRVIVSDRKRSGAACGRGPIHNQPACPPAPAGRCGTGRGLMGKTLLLTTTSLLILFAAVPLLPTAARAADDAKPYKVENGIVDQGTYNGYRRYGESCLRCHGPDGSGSSYAPNLTDSLKHMTKEQFQEVVINGRQNVTTSQD